MIPLFTLGKSFDFMTPADSVRRLEMQNFGFTTVLCSFDVFSCGVLPESGGVGTPAETLLQWKGLKSSKFVTPDDSVRNRKMRKMMSLNCSICLMSIFGVGKVYRIWTPTAVLPVGHLVSIVSLLYLVILHHVIW